MGIYVWVCVLFEKYIQYHYVINNLERELNFSKSLKMDIVKMSLLTVLVAEKREWKKKWWKKADPFTFPSSSYARSIFFLFFSLVLHAWKRQEKQKHHCIEHRPMMYSSNKCASRFFVMRSSVRYYILFSRIFLACVAYTLRPKQRKARPPPSLSLSLSTSTISSLYLALFSISLFLNLTFPFLSSRV